MTAIAEHAEHAEHPEHAEHAASGARRARVGVWGWPKRIVSGWWLLLALATLLLVAAPELDVTFRHYALGVTLETFNALVATMVAFVGFARYVFVRRPFDLAIAGAFGAIAITALIFGLILPFSGYSPLDLGDAPAYGWMLTRLVAGVLLLVGVGWRAPGGPALGRAGRWLGGLLGAVLLADLALWTWHAALPTLLQPRAWEILSRRGIVADAALPGQTMLGIGFALGVAALYVVLALRLSVAVTTFADAWLALSLIAAAVAEFQSVLSPAPYHPAITTADLLWLISYLLLLAYLGHQYLLAASGMRRQQARGSALLALSQTDVAERDRGQVIAAARRAAAVVAPEAAIEVLADAVDPPATFAAAASYPIAADGLAYGWLVVRRGGTLEPDADEYLRIVANQTASLLRAIDLYDELADGAVREERAQLARELHDGLAQDLAVLRLRLSAERGPGDAHLVERALSEARYAITILRGQTAAPADFLGAIERQAEELADRFGCLVTVAQRRPLADVPTPTQITLLRLIREAVTNAGKHGAPGRIDIELDERDGHLLATVRDDGCGFDPGAPLPPDRFGIRGMRERAAAVGGGLDVVSRPGGGTTVRVRVPVEAGSRVA